MNTHKEYINIYAIPEDRAKAEVELVMRSKASEGLEGEILSKRNHGVPTAPTETFLRVVNRRIDFLTEYLVALEGTPLRLDVGKYLPAKFESAHKEDRWRRHVEHNEAQRLAKEERLRLQAARHIDAEKMGKKKREAAESKWRTGGRLAVAAKLRLMAVELRDDRDDAAKGVPYLHGVMTSLAQALLDVSQLVGRDGEVPKEELSPCP